jgi:hypothetical protein
MLNALGSSGDVSGIIALLHSACGVRFILASLASIDNMGILQSANSDQLYLNLGGFSMDYQQTRNQRESTYFSHARNSTCSQLLLVQNRSSA